MIKLYGRIVPKRLFGSVRVNHGSYSGRLQSKTVDPSTVEQTVIPDPGYNALSLVTVKAAILQEKTVTPSSVEQTVVPDTGVFGLSKVIVKAQGNHGLLQDKTVTPSDNQQTVKPDSNYYGLASVTVNPMPKFSEVAASDSNNVYKITLADGRVVTGVVEFDDDGLPLGVTDDYGNSVGFSGGFPESVTDGAGNSVPIEWGGE